MLLTLSSLVQESSICKSSVTLRRILGKIHQEGVGKLVSFVTKVSPLLGGRGWITHDFPSIWHRDLQGGCSANNH